jgi:hypothetical protein
VRRGEVVRAAINPMKRKRNTCSVDGDALRSGYWMTKKRKKEYVS